MNWRRVGRVAWRLGAALIGLELLYVLAVNVILFAGVIQHAANAHPSDVELGWTTAYSPWPGRAYVSGFWMRFQDPDVQFRLTVEKASVDVALWDLLHRTFHATRVRAQGVSYRMLAKVDSAAGMEQRLDAFPSLEGFSRPALRTPPVALASPPGDASDDWGVELDGVEATINELWFLEYRYVGPARVVGAFALTSTGRLWVGPAALTLEGGKLSAGPHALSSTFEAHAELTMAPVQVADVPGWLVLRTISGSLRFDAAIDDLGAADLYFDGLHPRGDAKLQANLQVVQGRVMPASTLEASLTGAELHRGSSQFNGESHARLTFSDDGKHPVVGATLSGTLRVPLAGAQPVVAVLNDVTGELVLSGTDLATELSLQRLSMGVGEARVRDASAITRMVSDHVPLIAPFVLGEGPLVVSATAYVTPDYTLVRLKRAKLGDSELEGAAVNRMGEWRGAAAGRFGQVPLGVRLRGKTIDTMPFVPDFWLRAELVAAGIQPEELPLHSAGRP